MLQGKENDKNYHICALHDRLFDEEAVAQKEQSHENSDILLSERENSMDRDFINDEITDEAGTESQNSQKKLLVWSFYAQSTIPPICSSLLRYYGE